MSKIKKYFFFWPTRYISKVSDIEHRAVIKVFTHKDLNAIEIYKELDSIYKDSVPFDCTIAKWVAEFKDSQHDFEDAS